MIISWMNHYFGSKRMLEVPIIDKAGHPNPPFSGWEWVGCYSVGSLQGREYVKKREPWKKPVDTCAIGSINSQMLPIGDGKINPINRRGFIYPFNKDSLLKVGPEQSQYSDFWPWHTSCTRVDNSKSPLRQLNIPPVMDGYHVVILPKTYLSFDQQQ